VNATSISVGAGTGVNRGIQAGDLLLIIQMQGADIDATDTNAYGDGTANAGVTSTVAFGVAGYAGGISGTNFVAGNYEWAVATGGGATFAGGGTINLSRGLSQGFFTRAGSSTTGKQAYQVVRVPQYSNVTVTGGLTVQAWNGSSGGILAIDAVGDINLNGQTIDGNGRGFRGAGGVNVTPQCITTPDPIGCLEYRGLIADTRGGSKGEGLVGTPGRVYDGDPLGTGVGTIGAGADGYVNGDLMRGAPGNAGGGGNQHNGGGGGGGNGGVGGNGGNSWNNSQVTYVGTLVGGFGGSTSQNAAARWVLGGGGGAADLGGNTTTSPDGSGGAAGAMVVLRASRLVGGATINLNGVRGQDSRATDGAGGGGAGGTLVLALGAGGVAGGAITANATGGAGGAYTLATNEQDGTGAGGGGGVLIHNIAVGSVSFTANGGAAGLSASLACAPATVGADCGQRAGSASAGAAGYAITSPGVQVGYECLPNLALNKITSTPVVTSSTGATAGYTISITNTGGGVRFARLQDLALPPGWVLASAPTYTYTPTQPLAAGRLSSGAETVAAVTSSTWAVGATPLSVPATGSNTLTWNHFAVAPVTNGVPGVITVNFVVSIPNTATVGTYHNGAGVSFLDPTRAAASTRTVSPLTNVSANRTATAYSANTTYANYNGAAATTVAGTNTNGLQAGPTTEDVRLVPDFSITKTAPATATPGTTFTYTLTPRNNGRPVGSQTFTTTQATDVALANVPTSLGSNPVTLTDTLPSSITLTSAFNGTGWTCSATGTVVCTLANANAYPIAASTNFAAVTATARFSVGCSGGPGTATNTVSISQPVQESVTTNNTAVAVTTPTCASASLAVTKTNNTTTLVAGSTTSYTITVANLGPNAAPGTTVLDPTASGLSCSTPTCTATAGASCPAPLNTFQTTGVTITPTFNAGATVTFVLSCNVTATGQ
jgi:mucin-19